MTSMATLTVRRTPDAAAYRPLEPCTQPSCERLPLAALAGTGSVLSGTMKRLGNLTNSKDSRHMLYLVVFVVVVLLLVYKLSRP